MIEVPLPEALANSIREAHELAVGIQPLLEQDVALSLLSRSTHLLKFLDSPVKARACDAADVVENIRLDIEELGEDLMTSFRDAWSTS